MNRILRLSLAVRLTLLLVVAGLAIMFFPAPASTSPVTHQLTMDARQFEFSPGRIEVNQGDTVMIKLSALDATHGFYLDGYGLEQRVVPGITQEITFVANQPGKFRYRCSVSCGPLHPFMIGELVVNNNLPFWRAAALVAASLMGMLIYLWTSERKFV